MNSTPHSSPVPDPRDKKKFYFVDTSQRRALILLARALYFPFMKREVVGLENFPRDGAIITAANHLTNFDVFPLQFALPRVIFYMVKAELFKNPIMDVIIRNLGGFPVQRGEKDQWALENAMKILRHGQTLGMFPEGTRTTGSGLKVAKTGTAKMAIEVGCPIVPMTIVRSDRFFRKFPRRVRVHIQILPPMEPKPGESPLALTDRLMFTLARSLPVEMRGVYTETPQGFES